MPSSTTITSYNTHLTFPLPSLLPLTLITASPSLRAETVTDSPEVKKWVNKYLGVGEWVMDQSVAVMGSSSFFERKR